MINAAVQRQIAAIAPPVTIVAAIGAGMSLGDQKWLNANLNSLPQFLQTPEGRDVIQITLDDYKKYHGDSAA